MHIEISRHFRKYTTDKGLRLPVCLQNVPAPKPVVHTVHSGQSHYLTAVSRVASLDDADLPSSSAGGHRPTSVSRPASSRGSMSVAGVGTRASISSVSGGARPHRGMQSFLRGSVADADNSRVSSAVRVAVSQLDLPEEPTSPRTIRPSLSTPRTNSHK